MRSPCAAMDWSSQIILHAAGGLTVPESVSWGGRYASVAISANQQIFISLAGPFTGFIFAALLLRYLRSFGRRDCPKFHIRICSLSLCFVPSGLGNFDFIFHEPALGEYLLGIHQSYARPPIGWRHRYQVHFDPNRSVEWITHVALGFGHHRCSGCHSRSVISTKHLHGDLIWHAGISKFSSITKRRRTGLLKSILPLLV